MTVPSMMMSGILQEPVRTESDENRRGEEELTAATDRSRKHMRRSFELLMVTGAGPLNIGREVGGGWRQKCSDTNFWGPAKMSGPEPTSR